MKLKKFIYLLMPLMLFVLSCQETEDTEMEDPVVVAPKQLVSATFVKEYTKEGYINSLGQLGPFVSSLVKNGVKQYKIIYKTKNTDGKDIQASGAMIVPVGAAGKIPLISYQHGTIFNETDAPSYFPNNGGEGSLLASTGYIVSAPDYIGYGASNNVPHTYEHREGLANASLDMLRAVKEAITQEKIDWNQNVFVAGYSEGGFASMSLLKKIEETAPSEFNVKAGCFGAGAYNKTLSFKTMVSTKSSGLAIHNASYIWVLLTYDFIYKLNRPLSSYFVEPYATQVEKEKQNAVITGNFADVLNPTLKAGIIEGTDSTLFAAVSDNDVFDWKPITPIRLYHGDKDDYVPYFNSQTAFDAMKKSGADVDLITVAGGDHNTSIREFLFGSLQYFDGIK